MSSPPLHTRLVRFLQDDLAIPASAMAIALRQDEQDSTLLPMILWQYGLITLDQLNQVFDWLETIQ